MTTTQPVLLETGFIPEDMLKKLCERHDAIELIHHGPREKKPFNDSGLEVTIYPDLDELNNIELEQPIGDVWVDVINDHQTFLIYQRGKRSIQGIPEQISEIIKMCVIYYKWLLNKQPKMIIYTSSPHNIKTWVFARMAEKLSIPVHYFQYSMLPWRSFLLSGLHRSPSLIKPDRQEVTAGDEESLAEYVRKKRGGLEDALPLYERERISKGSGLRVNYFHEAKKFIKRPVKTIRRVKWFNNYKNNVSANDFWSEKFAVFYLHFQPERTSVPEGYGFGVQLAAIMCLREALPDNVNLVIKEHPSMFTYKFSNNYRYASFYDDLLALPRVHIAPIDVDQYRLMDAGVAVASITGTVIGEALIRGKAGIAFGEGPIQGGECGSFHRYICADNLKEFLRQAIDGELPEFDAKNYFGRVLESSFSGLNSEIVKYDEKKSITHRAVSVCRGVEHLMSNL
jgi:hypothetical protein